MTLFRQFFSHRLMWLALLVSVGIGALFARTIWTIRNDEWSYAVQTNDNLVRTLDQGLGWALDSFDNSLRARGAGDVFVLDAQGNVVLDSGSLIPRKGNFADRDYFAAFQSEGHKGLFVGKPLPSRVSGLNILPLARGYANPDGSFGGVVVGAIRVSYFNELFGSLDLGPNSGINLIRQDGAVRTAMPMWGKPSRTRPT
jgi:hypothetical protein